MAIPPRFTQLRGSDSDTATLIAANVQLRNMFGNGTRERERERERALEHYLA